MHLNVALLNVGIVHLPAGSAYSVSEATESCMHLHSLGLWLQGRSTVCLPLGVGKAQSTKTVKLEILHRFEYDSKILMSGVIAKADTSKSERAQVLIKGAPYEVTQLADPDSLPNDWAQVRCTHRMLTKTAMSCLNLHVCCCDLCLPFCIQTCVYLFAYRLWTKKLAAHKRQSMQ